MESVEAVLKPKELITRKEYARRKGVAPRTIGKYIQQGLIPLHDNKVDPIEADMCLSEVLVEPLGSGNNPTNTGKKKSVPEAINDGEGARPGTFIHARTREKEIKVEMLELDLQLKKGEMVLTKDVKVAAFTAAREVRDRMLNIPDRIAAIVAAETDEIKVRNIIMTQIEQELESLSKKKKW
jgi:hypothetical protein